MKKGKKVDQVGERAFVICKEIVLNSDGSFTLVEHQPGERTLVILITPQEIVKGEVCRN